MPRGLVFAPEQGLAWAHLPAAPAPLSQTLPGAASPFPDGELPRMRPRVLPRVARVWCHHHDLRATLWPAPKRWPQEVPPTPFAAEQALRPRRSLAAAELVAVAMITAVLEASRPTRTPDGLPTGLRAARRTTWAPNSADRSLLTSLSMTARATSLLSLREMMRYVPSWSRPSVGACDSTHACLRGAHAREWISRGTTVRFVLAVRKTPLALVVQQLLGPAASVPLAVPLLFPLPLAPRRCAGATSAVPPRSSCGPAPPGESLRPRPGPGPGRAPARPVADYRRPARAVDLQRGGVWA